MTKTTGYVVVEFCEDYEQVLRLCMRPGQPKEGVLNWADKEPRAIFPSRTDAHAAINRTEHYRLAFGLKDFPEKRYCRVIPVVTVGDVQ